MAAVREGDSSKLAILFDRHHRGLFRFFFYLTRRRERSEDLVQDVFFRTLRYKRTYQSTGSFRAWLYQIARNAHADYLASHSKEVEFPPLQLRSLEVSPEAQAGRNDEARLLRRALDALPAEKREILVLSRFQGLRYEEIASILQCEVGTVKVRIYRALRELGDNFFALRGERAS